MPRTRRAANGPTATGQSTLSFKNRVTKPSDPSTLKQKPALNEPAAKVVTEEIVRQTTPEVEEAELKGKAPAKVESPVRIVPSPSRRRKIQPVDQEYEAAVRDAQKVSDAQIRKYWKIEEDKRMTPRVHQKDVHLHEKILRHYDLSSEYGSCIGITRLKRWKRAQGMDLSPPIEVLAVLLKEDERDAKKEPRNAGRIAYVDELGGTKEL